MRVKLFNSVRIASKKVNSFFLSQQLCEILFLKCNYQHRSIIEICLQLLSFLPTHVVYIHTRIQTRIPSTSRNLLCININMQAVINDAECRRRCRRHNIYSWCLTWLLACSVPCWRFLHSCGSFSVSLAQFFRPNNWLCNWAYYLTVHPLRTGFKCRRPWC